MPESTASTARSQWGLILTLQSGVVLVSFWVGVYVGSTDIEPVDIRLRAHERIEVHDGAVRRPVYEAELRTLRSQLNDVFRRLERIEESRSRADD